MDDPAFPGGAGGPGGSAGRDEQDRQAERWLRQLRDGSPPQKAEARRRLATIFAARGMTGEAVELLVANAKAGYRDAGQFETLARLYRVLGNEYLAASAALEAARLRERSPGTSQPLPSAPQPSRAGPVKSPASQDRPPRHPTAGPQPPPSLRGHPAAGRPPTPPPWQRPLRLGGWVAFAGILIAAMAVAGMQPVSAVAYGVAAVALGLLLTGNTGLRRLLRVPTGPLGNGMLVFVALLLFLMGGALLPRNSYPPPVTVPPPETPDTLYSGTPTPQGAAPIASPAPGSPSGPSPAPVASPAASDASGSAGASAIGSGTAPSQSLPGAGQTAAAAPSPATSGAAGSVEPTPSSVPSNAALAEAGRQVRIIDAGNEGVRLRPEPGAEEVLKVLTDGAVLTSLGEEREEGGRQWHRVRDPDGTEGWIAADFLAEMPRTPTVVAAAPTSTAVPAAPTSTAVAAAPTRTATTEIIVAAAVLPTTSPPTRAATPAPTQAQPQPATPAASAPAPKPQAATQAPAPKPTSPPAPPPPKPTTPPSAPVAPRGMDCPAAAPIKGNHSSSGEWIYHVPTGRSYRVTRPEDCFATEEDARRAGYRASLR